MVAGRPVAVLGHRLGAIYQSLEDADLVRRRLASFVALLIGVVVPIACDFSRVQLRTKLEQNGAGCRTRGALPGVVLQLALCGLDGDD
ncbi:hypothetical protein I4F81_006417 [Pyropia yezoensis]|uniref:Uncharacterized protein n=1 Tax=Pyropia yezoensis TaxID=2788 RepID=A0ACC3C1X8_PYRYE|nr:hypothetical protein I4F81_006417 [Neopyropia yezoensis]